MLVGIFKDKIKNSESYIYLDYINGYKYHGVEICNGIIKPLDRDIIVNIYESFKINDNCKYIKDYKEYKVYYDDINNLYHYMKDNKEDMLMFLMKNGENALLHTSKHKLHVNRKDYFRKIVSSTVVAILSVNLFYSLLVSNHDIAARINTDLKTDISYLEEKITGKELNDVTVEDLYVLINNSERLSQDEKNFFCNYELISRVIPYYTDTNMKYAIKSRLDSFDIVYGDIHDGAAGYYAYSNEIVLGKEFEKVDIDDEYKKSVASHEFVHLLQAECPAYIKEASAEIISSEFFDRTLYSYVEACNNMKLLVETIGPKVLWGYIFSGNSEEFDRILKNNLDKNDYNRLIQELDKSPFDGNPDHELITSIIHKLYRNIYNENMIDNHDIYDFDGNYIDKLCFKPNSVRFSKVICCSMEEALKQGIGEMCTYYYYEKPISNQEFYDFLKNNCSTLSLHEDKSCEVCIKPKDKSKEFKYFNFDGKKIKIYFADEEREYDFNYELLKELSENYNFYYNVSTSDKNEITDPSMILIGEFEALKSKDKKYFTFRDSLFYEAKNILDRFPDQIIKREVDDKNNILN